MKKHSYNKMNDLKYSSLIYKSSLEYLNNKTLSVIKKNVFKLSIIIH